jgi:hypothetical protein
VLSPLGVLTDTVSADTFTNSGCVCQAFSGCGLRFVSMPLRVRNTGDIRGLARRKA